jgi:hypothetical protein
MFYFYSPQIASFGSVLFPESELELDQKNCYLTPVGFDPYKHDEVKIRYGIRNVDAPEQWKKYLDFIEKTRDKRFIVGLESFLGAPCARV